MRKYLLGTGLLGTLTSGYTLLKESDRQRLTWRVGLAWLSWLISLSLAIGQIRDIRIATRGGTVDDDSPIAGKEHKYAKRGAAGAQADQAEKKAKKARRR